MTKTFGTGDYKYELVEDWGQWPIDGVASDIATTSNGCLLYTSDAADE